MKNQANVMKRCFALLTLTAMALSSVVAVNAESSFLNIQNERDDGVTARTMTDDVIHNLVKSDWSQVDALFADASRSSTTVRTTDGTSVRATVYTGDGYTDEEIAEADETFSQDYPNVVKLGQQTPKYNCHSYAWYDRSELNGYWIEDVESFIGDSHTVSLSENELQPGDIVVYRNNHGDPVHSAVISSIDHSGTIQCTSKWGFMGLYLHAIDDVPPEYSLDGTSGTTFDFDYYRYYQGVHNYVETPANVIAYNDSSHVIGCTACYATSFIRHKYRYNAVNAYNHKGICRVCSFSVTGAHEVDPNTEKCTYCLYAGPFATVTSIMGLNLLKSASIPLMIED